MAISEYGDLIRYNYGKKIVYHKYSVKLECIPWFANSTENLLLKAQHRNRIYRFKDYGIQCSGAESNSISVIKVSDITVIDENICVNRITAYCVEYALFYRK